MREKGSLIIDKPEKVCFFAVADADNFKYGLTFWKSMVHFHDPNEITMLFYTSVKDKKELDKLPKGIIVVDLSPLLDDTMFYYRQKPIIAESLLDQYDLVVGFDVDQIVLHRLDDILNIKTYDIGVVINWNRHDEKYYPLVELGRIGIAPAEYFNCGMVAMRSKDFVHKWKMWCFSEQFNRCQYKEQDGLNILAYSSNHNVWCFDMPTSKDAPIHWYGIIAKGELVRAKVEEKQIIVPKGLGNTPFPPNDVILHLIHLGGGQGAPKDNWSAFFQPEVWEYIQKEIINGK